MAAVGMLLSAALVGGGIDMSRAYRVKNRLQSSCDAAALAGRRAVTSSGFNGTAAETQANNFFTTNFDDTLMETTGTTKTFSSADNGQTVNGTASTTLNLAVMKIFGFRSFNLSVTCQASMGVGNSDVVLVLDTTGSMGSSLGDGTRISALRDAMKDFYTTVKNATAGTNARVRYGFVPYSSTVNVGHLLYDLNPAYLKDQITIQSRVAKNGTVDVDTDDSEDGTKSDYGSQTWDAKSDCKDNLPDNTPWTNNGAASNLGTTDTDDNGWGDQRWVTTVRQPQQRTVYECYKTGSGKYRRRTYTQTQDQDTNTNWYWEYRPVTYPMSTYKAFAAYSANIGSYGGSISSTWEGCIEERSSTNASSFSYSTTTGLSPSAAKDLDIDSAPTDDASAWGPMWPQAAYHRYSDTYPTNTGYRVSSYCPYQSQLLATMTQSEFDAYADNLHEEGSTYLDIGMVWGGRLSSPDGIFSSNVNIAPLNGGEVSRHIIFMTDGIMEPNNDIQSAWGIEYHDKRVTSDGSSNDASRHTSRFRAICDEIKAKGIRIWTISFTSGTNSDLSYCASANSYFNADDADELDDAFQEIAKQVGELRLIQ